MRGETNLQDLESGPYFGSYALQGRRKKMEDSAILAPCLVKCKAELGSAGTSLSRPLHDAIEDPSPLYTDANEPAGAKEDILHFFAVYDGHGGAVASRFCAKRLHHFFSARLHLLASLPPGAAPPAMPCQDGPAAETGGAEDEHVAAAGEKSASSLASSIQEDCFGPQTVDLRQLRPLTADMITDALEYAFLEAHERFCRKTAVELIGTTATVGVVSSTHIFVAFSGDSRAVLRKHGVAYPVTLDQKPERPDEAERIKAAGGNIYVTDGQRVEGILGMTRAIGDSALTTAGVTPLPEVTVLRRAPGDEMLVLASDGLWECVSNEVSVEAAHRCLELVAERGKGRNVGAKHAAKVLANHAFKKGSGDNITVLVLDLAGPDDRKPKTQSASEGKAGGGEPMDVDGG
ncbi:unnamed protein product [Pedinophyceae sp. YPF-701]|nr:unnamed protein product [Pedinophyceae sp. YPF-701]